MALEPITRQEQIIAGKKLEPITRMEKFLKDYGVSNYFGTETKVVKGDTLTWDGNTDGLVSVKLFGEIISYRVSDATPTVEQLENGGSFIAKFYEDMPYSFGANGLENWSDNENVAVFMQKDYIGLVVAYSDGATFADTTFPEKGLYFTVSNRLSEPAYALSLTIPGYGKFVSEQTVVKPLDEKYMPLLTSPGGKKFKLSVDDSGVLSVTEI